MARQIRALAARTRPAARIALAARTRETFDFGRYASRVLAVAYPSLLDVTAVIPNYNYAHYLRDRLDSVFAQTHPVAEVIVLDDGSSDDSHSVARDAAANAGRSIRWMPQPRNGGSVFRQWRRAAELARSEWVWIAEADDLAQPGFLAALAAAARAAPAAVMAFTDSRAVDAEGQELWPDHQAYYSEAGVTALARDTVFSAAEMLRTCLGSRNMVINASAVLWRRDALCNALDRCGTELETFRMAGDWRLYAEVLATGGHVAYVARPLNIHRRHDASVTSRLPPERHLAELERMQRHMRSILGPQSGLLRGQRRAVEATREALARDA